VRIGGVALSTEDVVWLEHEGQQAGVSRSALARKLCERKKLMDGLGRPRVTTVRLDLSRLARAGQLSLPLPSWSAPSPRRPVVREQAIGPPRPPARSLAELGPVTVILLRGASDPWHPTWNHVLNEHHYLGAGPLCGAQLRYVVCTQDQVVAAASFSSAALQVAARDEFIGWTARARQRNRSLVIDQSRFCVTVQVPNLASHVHGLLLSRVADDWNEAYGRRPVLVESFVDTTRFDGTCYRAANWQHVGETSGRGRQDREHEGGENLKSIWVYPLEAKWWEALCLEPVREIDPDADWAETEWGSVDLGDQRLTHRLVEYGRARFAQPTATLPQACGSRASTKAAYRLLQHPTASLEQFLSGHFEATLSRATRESVVLAIQDTTSLNYTTHPATEGLGPIGSYGATKTLGMEVHSMMLTSVSGLPLGLLDVQAWARDPSEYGRSKERDKRQRKDKESQKWLNGYAAADVAAQRLEQTQVVVVADREADIFELLETAVKGRAHLLVRAMYQRRVMMPDGNAEACLWDLVRQEPAAGMIEVEVPRRGTRPARVAQVEIRYRAVEVCDPEKRYTPRSVRVWAVTATETVATAPADAENEPIDWLLLTTLPVASLDAALEKVRWYVQRWQIEVYHRTLKSGCKVEERQSKTAASLEAALAVDVVVAWRVMMLAKLGREIPDVPCTAFFEEFEWKALCCFINKTPTPPSEPPTLREAMRMVAGLGGFLGRKSDGNPGTQTLWRGLERLSDISAACRIFFSSA
jgi:Druantia protein DruA/Transposase Tn5 dimerisation domain/Transposase DNA-binding